MSVHTRQMAVLTALFILSGQADPLAARERSRGARAEFQRHNPCPSNQARRGPCPGYVVDHVVPLMCGGADEPGNMQWQSEEAAKAKDREERMCQMRREPT